MKPVSRKRTRNVGPGRFISQYRQIKKQLVTASNMYTPRPQLFCVLLVQTHLRIDLALIPLLGNEACNSKKFYAHTRSIHGDASLREGGVCLRTLVDRKRKRFTTRLM